MGLLDDEIVVGFVFSVIAAIVVASLPLQYKQAILAFVMGGGLSVLGFKGGRQILRDKAEIIGVGIQVGIDQVEETLNIDIPDEWETAVVDKIVERLKAENVQPLPPTNIDLAPQE